MASIYQDYRGQNYTKIRKYWEPWYSSTYDDVDNESPYSHERRRILKQFLNNQNISSAQIIVDVGGNMGEFIPELEDLKERLVLEISQKELPQNIRRIESLEEVGGVDLVMYAHVLEHVPNPFSELEKFIEKSKYLYVEVPNGITELSYFRKSRVAQMLCILLAKSPKIWRKSTRVSWGRKKPMSILRQAEHINFFTEETFRVLGNKLGIDVVTKVSNIVAPAGQRTDVIQVLFKSEFTKR